MKTKMGGKQKGCDNDGDAKKVVIKKVETKTKQKNNRRVSLASCYGDSSFMIGFDASFSHTVACAGKTL